MRQADSAAPVQGNVSRSARSAAFSTRTEESSICEPAYAPSECSRSTTPSLGNDSSLADKESVGTSEAEFEINSLPDEMAPGPENAAFPVTFAVNNDIRTSGGIQAPLNVIAAAGSNSADISPLDMWQADRNESWNALSYKHLIRAAG